MKSFFICTEEYIGSGLKEVYIQQAPRLKNEESRLADLRNYEILDTPPELVYDQIIELAAEICKTPIALISFVDENRQWFKAAKGIGVNQTPRDISFCDHVVYMGEELEVKDAGKDNRFKDNPLFLDNPNITYYFGVPLKTPRGHNIGTLCVADHKPHELSDSQKQSLKCLARQVVFQMELNLQNQNLNAGAIQILEGQQKVLKHQTAQLSHLAQLAGLDRMAGGVAHEINNPLAILKGQIFKLTRMMKKHSTDFEAMAKYAEKSEKAIDRITNLLNAIVDFSSHHQSSIAKVEFDISECLLATIKRYQAVIDLEQIKIHLNLDNGVMATASSLQLGQCFEAVLENAIDAVKRNPVDQREVWISGKKIDGCFLVKIKDNGPGIAEKNHDYITEPFFTTKSPGQGMGLGLTSALAMLKHTGGSLELDRKIKTGASFSISIPLNKDSSSSKLEDKAS